jgi:biopolymer transport protein ExbB
MKRTHSIPFKKLFLCLLLLPMLSGNAHAWWNKEWTIRKKFTVDTGGKEAAITDPIGTTPVLIRLHDGNFQFPSAKEDGSDIRFVAADDKTLLPYHIEKYDAVLDEAFVWVKVPSVKSGGQTSFWLYYGSSSEKAVSVNDPKGTYDSDTVLVYHFSERNAPPADSTGKGNNASNPGVPMDGSIIANGLRFIGQSAVTIPSSGSLAWTPAGALTWSAWIKAAVLSPNAIIFSRHEGGNSFLIGLDNGSPFVEVKSAAGTQRSAAGQPVEAAAWHHLAVVASGSQLTLYLDGESYATLAAALPALNSPLMLGGDIPEGSPEGTAAKDGFAGEVDELEISSIARPAGFIKFAALSQGTSDKAAKLLTFANDESSGGGENELTKQLSIISDISKSLSLDGWIVIGLCAILAAIGMSIAVMKVAYLNRISKATKVFLKQWSDLAANLHVLDHGDEESIRSMGGQASPKTQKVLRHSPLYHIYHIGSSEIQDRLSTAGENFKGLSGRSMQSIRASLDGGMVRQVQKLNSSLVFLTIGIAGGPYLGLLGTVIGVMITFAVIAKSGAVEVNSIAPGIAGALLATVAGLAVAIPSLFAYSYISTRIKDAVSEMQIFIDEFVTKVAEFYSFPND